jgi:arylsulfatase
LYGNPVVKTPSLEKLVSEGFLFENAYCNYPACAPSRCSMMTGRYTTTIRNHANHMHLDPREVTLPMTLKRNGYTTAIIGKNHAFLEMENYYPEVPFGENDPRRKYSELERNFDLSFHGGHVGVQGMEDDEELKAAIQYGKERSWGQQHSFSVNPYPAEKSVTHTLASRACEYLKAHSREKPFFMWLSIPDPHTPYQVSEPYASMYDPETIPPPIHDSLEGKPEQQKVSCILDYNDTYDDRHFQEMRAIHYGMINQIDDNLARVFTTLEETGLKEDTIVVFTADHGDSMGDHGILQKHNFFYDSFCRIPFLFSWPGTIPAGGRGALASLVDLMPTLLELAEVEIPHGVQGTSLASRVRGEAAAELPYLVIESGESGTPLKVADIYDEKGELINKNMSFAWCAFRACWFGRGKALVTDQWKLCLYENGDGELYDLVNDPHERNNLYGNPEYAGRETALKNQLLQWFIRKDDQIPENPTVKLHYFE